ncbi:LacI family DNA-binding transcriptional regulator [Paenibacillus macerans]|uniref:LacI family DNA-binding transcriptional regulator n=1 Tax=Paenibacillus macerans TaxID=44252 RepID=UPI000EC987B1|nr:LacI family DNA-binding transcriptional regulator [Paenibacillus macerans]MBS5912428.1 LacI family DNA-binding transcriptional regulator [Paenibacillus macerans]MED4953372.1 LacI family DNA-binding transcriptional regulator [Paenibacillus macerans]GBK65022.1 LacI family transcriptional regulator [Paenibacillus macerans]GBK71315.1 LacI family transcriptional regulator [Paenibacillus macerans]
MASIKDVAKVAGVSVTTVSRVMNNRGYISKETRRKVEKAMEMIDYHPNEIARALQKNQSYFIGIIVPDSNHPFFSDLIKYVEMSANEKNYKLLVCNSLEDPDKEANYISMLRQNRVDGIIMCSHTMDIESYKKVPFPIVSFDRLVSPNIPCVGSDNYRGGELATEHLIGRGCNRLLHISGPLGLDMLSNRRRDAFVITCMKHGIAYDIIEGAHNKLTFDYFWSFIAEKLPPDKLGEYDGVFCSNDIVAYALYIYAQQHGIRVPEDFKIVGYDYHSFTRMLQNPKLTTIMQPSDRIGAMLTNTLIRMIENTEGELINNTTVDITLIQGETT